MAAFFYAVTLPEAYSKILNDFRLAGRHIIERKRVNLPSLIKKV